MKFFYLTLIFLFISINSASANCPSVCNCIGYDGIGGPCYDGIGGPA